MSQVSNVSNLSALLSQKAEADRIAIEAVTRQQLSQHEETLKRLSEDAMTTTRNAIEESQRQLIQMLSSHLQALSSMTDELENKTRQQMRRLLLITRMPFLLALFLCLILCGATWEYWSHQQPFEIVTASNGQKWEVMKPTAESWTLCENLKPARPCRRLVSSNN